MEMTKKIIFYSKKDGVNQLLFVGTDLLCLNVFDKPEYKKHKPFAYALVDGIEIKLFTDQEA